MEEGDTRRDQCDDRRSYRNEHIPRKHSNEQKDKSYEICHEEMRESREKQKYKYSPKMYDKKREKIKMEEFGRSSFLHYNKEEKRNLENYENFLKEEKKKRFSTDTIKESNNRNSNYMKKKGNDCKNRGDNVKDIIIEHIHSDKTNKILKEEEYLYKGKNRKRYHYEYSDPYGENTHIWKRRSGHPKYVEQREGSCEEQGNENKGEKRKKYKQCESKPCENQMNSREERVNRVDSKYTKNEQLKGGTSERKNDEKKSPGEMSPPQIENNGGRSEDSSVHVTHTSTEEEEEESTEEGEVQNEYSSDSEKNKVDSLLNGCRSVKNYRKLNKISEGTYGTVFRAKNKITKKIVAMKQLKHFSNIRNEGFAITSLREINILLQLKHENILSIKEVVIGNHLNDIYLVMEYIEHELKMLLDNKSPSFTISELKCLLKQLLSGVDYLHTNWVMHRDLKTTNLLYSNRGILKICDFGMARKYGHVPSNHLTKNVVTLWYRAPELLLGEKFYTNKIDIWSVGCIFAEMILKKPLFLGDNEIDQMLKILNVLGLPDRETYPEFYEYSFISKNKDLFKKKKIKMNVNNIRSHFPNIASQFSGLYLSHNGIDLLQQMLHFNPKNRISASDALKHPYFKELPKPMEISDMPVIPDSNKVIRSRKLANRFNLIGHNNIQFHS
ncbi:cdc2-related protein kinase 1, putative [Plasmodium ovale]|uniref:Cyclin-dependent kinase 2 homolog n=2 Tax=Plasmodium ovale TaxID=36330 RepID=A0A1A8VNL0_PLAOA|nr:cdc2-related protein kinase 1 [Plasmodium ovale curtisi]SBS82961.1 cdc2-related protein kinase 1 [Plasmodium ovale curtisi]SCA48693.1 cdc2-related protein kinase 1, putative [Plasmodium ovale]